MRTSKVRDLLVTSSPLVIRNREVYRGNVVRHAAEQGLQLCRYFLK